MSSYTEAEKLDQSKRVTKIDVDLDQNVFMVYPSMSVLITSKFKNEDNILAVSWTTVLSCKPPLHGIVVSPKRHSHELISKSRKFIINIPSKKILHQVVECGKQTGRNISKFEVCSLKRIPSIAFGEHGPPRIEECPVHIECEVTQEIGFGDHTLFVGEVKACSADSNLVKNGIFTPNQFQIPYHLGGHEFCLNEKRTHSF